MVYTELTTNCKRVYLCTLSSFKANILKTEFEFFKYIVFVTTETERETNLLLHLVLLDAY